MNNNLTIKINDMEYALSTKLRVAYVVQGQHNHKSYMELFSQLGEMTVEDQLDIIYAAFSVANPSVAAELSRSAFRAILLDDDDFNAGKLLEMLKNIVSGILGKDPSEVSSESKPTDETSTSGEAKN